MEELIFTGFMANNLSPSLRYIVTPIVFGATHYTPDWRMWLTASLNAGFHNYLHVINAYQTGAPNLTPSIISHILHNSTAFAYIYADKYMRKIQQKK